MKINRSLFILGSINNPILTVLYIEKQYAWIMVRIFPFQMYQQTQKT